MKRRIFSVLFYSWCITSMPIMFGSVMSENYFLFYLCASPMLIPVIVYILFGKKAVGGLMEYVTEF